MGSLIKSCQLKRCRTQGEDDRDDFRKGGWSLPSEITQHPEIQDELEQRPYKKEDGEDQKDLGGKIQ